MLRRYFWQAQTSGVVSTSGVIGDAKIFITALKYCFRHLLKRVYAIRTVGMRMQNSANVLIPNQ